MKKVIKVVSVLVICIFLSTVTSCKSDVIDDNNNATGECMDNISLHPTTHNAKQLFFLNQNEGWMIGLNNQSNAMLLHTSDGGQNWNVVNNDLGFGGVEMNTNGSKFKFRFTNSNQGYICLDLPINNIDNIYYYTNDGGVSWIPVPLPTLSNDEDISLYGMGVNSTKMVFAARVVNSNNNIDPCYRLYYVSNTSNTITNYVDIACGWDTKSFDPRDIHLTDSGVINMEATSSNPFTHYMAHSNNFGNSWTYTEIENPAADHSYMEFVNDNVGYLPAKTNTFADEQPYYKTTDGGVTWTRKTIGVDNGSSFAHFAFADENNGLAIRYLGSEIYKTTNGGDSWEKVSCFDNTNLALDIYATPLDIAYLSVDNGITLTSWMDVDATEDVDTYQTRVYFYKGE